jgi:3-hydroxymyristoyl/3-hydroxydecanoyl-(acyl carrier protein) dehydratase
LLVVPDCDCSIRPFSHKQDIQTNTRFEICIDAAHPALSGHFPGNPIVPGALLLAEIGARLTVAGVIITGIRKARFTQSVRPMDHVQVDCRPDTNGQLRFECRVADTVVARGSFVTAADSGHE